MLSLPSSSPIPVIRAVDVLILDGGLAGLEAARIYAGRGQSVLLAESNTYLGGKLTKTQRPWIDQDLLTNELCQPWFPVEKSFSSENTPGLAIFSLDDLKIHFEEMLLSAKVELLYAARPVDAYREQDGWMVILGGKFGRLAISAGIVIDNSDYATLTWASREILACVEKDLPQRSALFCVTATISFAGITSPCEQEIVVPESLGVVNNRVQIIQGGLEKHHGFVEFKIQPDRLSAEPLQNLQKTHFQVYETGFQLAHFLMNQVEAFQKAEIGLVSREALWVDQLSVYEEIQKGQRIAGSTYSGAAAAKVIITNPEMAKRMNGMPARAADALFRDDNELNLRSHYPKIQPRPVTAALLAATECCVSGGGTSGAVAGITAARQGLKTVVVDMNPVLGGTGTIGGVHTHWMSSNTAISAEIDDKVKELGKQLRIPERYPVDLRTDEQGKQVEWFKDYSWNKEVKAYILYEMNRAAGTALYTNCILFGTLTQNNCVTGTVYATPLGPYYVLSEVTIDATGDGDVAAFAGAEYIYGAERDRYSMWTSMAQYASPENTLNNFTSPADVGDIFDYTRFILASRRRFSSRAYDHVEYVTPRESRHIVGEYTITLKDQLLQKSYPDTVAVFYSNYDLRGRAFADIVLWGLMPPNLDIEIPYRALLPRSLENIIIAGKAYSITHDALSSARMQKDMQQLGASVAAAAFYAIREKQLLRKVLPEKICSLLKSQGNLPPLVDEKRTLDRTPNLSQLIDQLEEDERTEWLLMGYWERAESISPIISLCYADSEEVIPLLQKAHQKAAGKKRLLLARLLLWHKNDSGIQDVIRSVYQEFDEEHPLPKRKGDIYWTTGSPEQGIMPEVLYSIYPLGRIKNPQIYPLIKNLVDLIQAADRDYTDHRKGIYDYIDCVVYIAERQAEHLYIPLLEQLLELPELQDTLQTTGFSPNHIGERLAYLTLSIHRALARCGSKKGLDGLAAYLDDNRSYLSKSAHDELRQITHLELPLDHAAWAQALMAWPDELEPAPLNMDIL